MRAISIAYLWKRIQSDHPRTRKAQLNTLLGLIVKGGSLIISLLLVPITIDYVSKNVYGTWLTISSMLAMLTFLDIGVGNGLRNKFSEAVTKNDTVLARTYVSTSYLTFGIIQLLFTVLFLGFFRFIPWQSVFNTTVEIEQLQVVILLTVLSMAIKLVLDILSYILLAFQESGQVGLINLATNSLILVGVYTLSHFTSGNLILLASITVLSPIIVLMISGFILYNNKLRDYRPSIKLANFKHAKGLLSLGYKFFFIQIAVLVLFYSDTFIITQLFGPSEVATYNVSFRYFNAINTLFIIVITPYWSAFSEAIVKGDKIWMAKSYKLLQKIWLGLVLIVIVMIIMSDVVYGLWIGERISVPFILSINMGVFTLISCWNSITATVINGLGKIQLQLYFALFSAFINIPLSILLARNLSMGSAGVVLATSLSLLFCSVFGSLQAQKLISGTAKGIWNI